MTRPARKAKPEAVAPEDVPAAGRKVRRSDNGPDFEHGALRAFVERIEHAEEEKKAIGDDIKEIYAEAKGNGFDPRTLRNVVRIRRQDADKRREEQEVLDTYLSALGMI